MSRLTNAAIKAVKPASCAREIADGSVPGLALRVLPSGAKTWALRARFHGRRVRLDLGRYPFTTLAAARGAARSRSPLSRRVTTRAPKA
jgi:hypothetical protein